MSSGEQYGATREAARVAGIAGSFQPYFGSAAASIAFVQNQDIRTQAEAQPIQTMLANAASLGVDITEVVAYSQQTAAPLVEELFQGKYSVGTTSSMPVFTSKYTDEPLYARGLPQASGLKTKSQLTLPYSAAPTGPDRPELFGGGIEPITVADVLAGFNMTTEDLNRIGGSVQRMERSGMGPIDAYGLAGGMLETYSDAASYNTAFDYYAQFGEVSQDQSQMLTASARGMSPYQQRRAASIGQNFAQAGIGSSFNLPAYAGLPEGKMGLIGDMASGNLQALSYATYSDGFDPSYRMYDQARQPIYQTDMMSFLETTRGQARMGNVSALGAVSGMPGYMRGDMPLNYGTSIPAEMQNAMGPLPSPAGMMTDFFSANSQNANYTGAGDTEAMEAWAGGGSIERTALHRQRMAGFSLASAGIAIEGINLRRDFLWGQDEGGTWDAPAQGSMWNLEDRQRRMGHQSQMRDFASSRRRMDTGERFAQRNDVIQQAMTDLNRGNQDWEMGFQRETSQMQRGWQRNDWEYGRQMGAVSFGWQMEDADEAIRTTGGRARRKAIQQKDRAAFSYSSQRKHTDEKEEQQEEMWAREDERFNKQIEHIEHLRDLEDESREEQISQRQEIYEMDRADLDQKIADYQEQYALQQVITDKQREFQMEQMLLQEKAAGVQAAAAIEQINYNEEIAITGELHAKEVGTLQNMIAYSPIPMLEKLNDMVMSLSDVKDVTVDKLTSLNVSYTDPRMKTNLDRMVTLTRALGTLNPSGINALINLINAVDDYKD